MPMMFIKPQPSDGFEWMQAPSGPILRCRALAQIADHFFTTSALTLDQGSEEWTAVADLAGVAPRRLRLLRQVHGRTIAATTDGSPWDPPEADGIISSDPSVALVVRVADCAPILIADRRRGVVAAVHGGWRSTMQRIVIAAVEMLRNRHDSRPVDLVAAVGPSLGACCGEMGEEVVAAFRSEGHPAEAIERWFSRGVGRPRFDLWLANADQLREAGVPPESVYLSGLCTRCFPEIFHSYRAMGRLAGRMAGVIRARG
jgi:hypothetical protein